MLKETLQRSSESFGSNYYLKENLIYQASTNPNRLVTHNLNSYIVCRQNSDTMISSLLSSFCIRNIWIYIFYSSGLPRKFPGPSNQWLFVVCLCHCCVSRLLCCSSVLWLLRSQQRKSCILRRLQYKQTRTIFQCRSHDIENMCQASFLSII